MTAHEGWARGHHRIDLRLLPAAVVTWTAAALLITHPSWAGPAAGFLWATAAVAAAAAAGLAGFPRPLRWAARGRWAAASAAVAAAVAVAVATGGLVASAVSVAAPARFPAEARAAALSHARVDALVVVNSRPSALPVLGGGSGRVRFRGTITELTVRGRRSAVSVPVVVYAEKPVSVLAIGGSIRLGGTLSANEAGSAAAAQLFGKSPPTAVSEPSWWLAWSSTLRSAFSAAASVLPGDGGDLLPGLAIGDTSAVDGDLDTAMKQSSLSHLTAVSGANCAVVIAAVMFAGGCLGLRRRTRVAAALGALAGFVVLVTPDPSVLRAAVMAVIVMVSMASGRPSRGIPALAVAAIVLLVIDPWRALNAGFALSVLATAGLLVLAAPLGRALSRWMPTWLAGVIAIPLAAQLACQPVLLLLSPTLPVYGVPANLLAAPAAPLATVLGLASCLLLPWAPVLGAACLHLAWLPAAFIAAVATTCAALPGSGLPWLAGLPGLLTCAALTIALLVALLRRRGRWPALAAGTVLVVFLGAYTGSLLGAGITRALGFPQDWQITACDIGQGDAVLVRDGNAYALVDVGPDPRPLAACLRTLRISHIDLLVLTHYDLDHVGGADAVIGKVGVALVGRAENAQDELLHTRLARGGAVVRVAAQGDNGTLGRLRWNILWPTRGGTTMQTGNPGSVTIGFDGRGIRSIFLGDLGEEAQDAMVRAANPEPVDVVKVAHHGSADQSAALYRRLYATAGIISVGADNGYGHPTQRLLGILEQSGTTALRTDRSGMVVIAPAHAGALRVWTERAALAGRPPTGGPG